MANDKKFIAKNGIQGLDASVFTSITTSGKVGVGTASPVAGLDVLGTSGYIGTIHNHLYANGEGARIFGQEATLDILGQDGGDHASSVYLRNGIEGFAWINDPISDSFQLRSFTSTGNNFFAHGPGSAVSNLVSILDISKTGNVGIGTDAPGEKLDVNGDVRVRGSGGTIGGANIANASLLVGSTTTGIGIDTNEIYAKGDHLYLGVLDAASDIYFRYGNIKLVTIKSGGNVGIGTDTPATILDISASGANGITLNEDTNNASLSGRIFLNNGTAGKAISIMNNGNSLAISTGATPGSASGSEKVRILENGNVGIGTNNPNTLLTVLSKGATTGPDTRVLELKNNGTAFNTDALASYNANTSYDVANGATLTYHSRGTAAGNIMAHVAGVNSEPVLTDRIVRLANSTSTAMYNRTYFSWDGAGSAAADMNTASTQLLETVSATGQTGSAYALYANGDVMYKGSLTLGQADNASAHINSYELMTFNIDTDNDDTNRYFAWYTNGLSGTGTQRMILDEGGNLGIGTATPRKQLHVLGGTGDANTTTVRFGAATNTDTNHSPKIELPETVDGNADMIYGFSITGDGNSTNNLLFRGHNNSTGGTVALSIDRDTANVGIGTNDPGDDKLYVTGGRSRLEVQNVPNGVISSNASTVIEATEAQLQIIGVDTGSWATNLTLTNAPVSGNNKHWTMHHTPASHPTVSNALQFNYLATNTVGNIGGDGTGAAAETKMTIANTGNVGIATETPSNVLHVHGSDSGITVSAAASDRPHIRLVNGTAEMLRLSANNLYGAIGDSSNSQRYMVFKNDFIGTNTQTAPNAQIHIGTATAEGDATNPALQIGGANTYRLGFYTEAELGVIDAANGDSGLAIHTKTIGEAVRINADGEVGIGTNNPFGSIHTRADNTRIIFAPGALGANLAAQHRLEFWEGVPTDANSADANYAIEYDGTSVYGGDGALLFRGYGSAQNQIYAGINRQGTTFLGMNGATPRVGIGTTNPVDKLDIRGNVIQIDGSPEYHFATASATHYNWRIATQEVVDQGFEIASGTQVAGTSATGDTYTNRFVIKASTGNVGIGTDAPGSRLEIYNSATAGNTQLHIHNDKTGDAAAIRLEGGRTSSNDATQINFANTGNIGSAIRMYSSGSNEGDMRFYTSTTSTGDATQERMRIETGGNVGIGTADATAKLHVWGSTILQGDAGVTIRSTSNNPTNGAIIYFTDTFPTQSQTGFIKYKHADSSVVSGSNEQMVFGGDQPISDFLFEGDVHSTGDVVAYFSDPRLKDFHGNITGALDKVNSLGGYYFTENELAKEIGYRNDRMQVGVNAEEVAAVLPEVVTTALVNENISQDEVRDYKTVKYEKMVPLLIEAIKELTEQNMEMKQRLDKLEGEA